MTDAELENALQHLVNGALKLGIALGDEQSRQFKRYCSMVLDRNRHFNLTALKTPEDVMRTLMLDSLTIASALPDRFRDPNVPVQAVDVGTGAGVPGIPLALVFPHWSLTLVESNGKKARFVQAVADSLHRSHISIVNARAEEIGSRKAYREVADLCLARAVSALPTLIELCAPLVCTGGLLVFPKSGDVESECSSAERAAIELQVRLESIHQVSVDLGLGANRSIVIYRKTGATPAGYPRRVGLANSHPIGSAPVDVPPRPRGRQSPAGSVRRQRPAPE